MINRNRLANLQNIYQTAAKRVLCVCSAGLLRSPTTANVLHQKYGFNTRAAGITEEYALIPVDAALLAWADEIVWVEQTVYDNGWQNWSDLIKHKRNIVLDIPDQYEWNHPELRALIEQQYADTIITEKATSYGHQA